MLRRVAVVAILVGLSVAAGCGGRKKRSAATTVDAGEAGQVVARDLGLTLAELETRWNAFAAQELPPLQLVPARELNAFRAEVAAGLTLSGVADSSSGALRHLELVAESASEQSLRTMRQAASLMVGAINPKQHDLVVLSVMSGVKGSLESNGLRYQYETAPDAGAHLLVDPVGGQP